MPGVAAGRWGWTLATHSNAGLPARTSCWARAGGTCGSSFRRSARCLGFGSPRHLHSQQEARRGGARARGRARHRSLRPASPRSSPPGQRSRLAHSPNTAGTFTIMQPRYRVLGAAAAGPGPAAPAAAPPSADAPPAACAAACAAAKASSSVTLSGGVMVTSSLRMNEPVCGGQAAAGAVEQQRSSLQARRAPPRRAARLRPAHRRAWGSRPPTHRRLVHSLHHDSAGRPSSIGGDGGGGLQASGADAALRQRHALRQSRARPGLRLPLWPSTPPTLSTARGCPHPSVPFS